MWLVSVPLRVGHARIFRSESRIAVFVLALGSYLACIGVLLGVSVAMVGLYITLWRGIFLHLSCTLAIFALYGWETTRQHRDSHKKKTREREGEV